MKKHFRIESAVRQSLLMMSMALILTLSGCGEAEPSAGATGAAQPAVNTTPTANAAAPATIGPGPVQPEIAREMPPSTTTGNGPQLTFTTLSHDFGKLWDIREHKTTFPFRNTGTETLIIETVKASCGCTALELEKKIFEPGEGAEIKVAFSPKGKGYQTKNITITSNAANGTLKRLTIAADIVPVVTLEPTPYLNFGTVQIGEEHTRIITLKGRYPEVIVDSINAPNSLVSARVVEADGVTDVFFPTEPRSEHKIAVTLHKNARWGGFYTAISVKSRSAHPETGEQIEHSASIHVSANVFGAIHASDTMFRIGATPLGTPFQKIVNLTSADGQPFTVTGAYLERASMPGMKLTVDPIDQAGVVGYRFTISGNPGAYQGPVNGRVLVMTDIPGEEQFYIPINGIVRKIQ